MARVEALHSSESAEWYTPSDVAELGRATMGGIDLDPASCAAANEIIRALAYYTVEDDGIAQPWYGRVWLNPPYGRDDAHVSNQGIWSRRLIEEYTSGRVEQAMLLINAVPDRRWFHPLWRFPISFAYRRIRFVPPGGAKKQSPTHPSALVYFGPHVERFRTLTEEWGRLVLPERPAIVRRPVRRVRTPVRIAA